MADKQYSAGIIGTGSFLPDKILTNKDLENMVDTSDEWIVQRTGIKERRILDSELPAYSMGVKAAKNALDSAGIQAKDIDLIIVSTSTPDYLTPSTACLIQKELGAINSAAFDLNAACTGFIYAISVANQFIMTGTYKNILLISVEALSRVTDWNDRNTCVLFGDGAGAVVIGRTNDGSGILASKLGAVGELGEVLTIPCCHVSEEDKEKRNSDLHRVLWMDGGRVLKFAVNAMADASSKVIEMANLKIEDVDYFVPHQANIRILKGAAKKLNIPMKKVFCNLESTGNISSACVPVGLDQSYKKGLIKKDDIIVIVGFGGGLTWGSSIIKWSIGGN